MARLTPSIWETLDKYRCPVLTSLSELECVMAWSMRMASKEVPPFFISSDRMFTASMPLAAA